MNSEKPRSYSLAVISTSIIFLLVTATVYINVSKQMAVDNSKIPEKVEQSLGFQRWITNLKNKGIDVGADDFQLWEENEIYNTKWLTIYSLDQPGKEEEFNQTLTEHENVEKVVFSPSKRMFVDYRNVGRGDLEPNEVHLYGAKDDKILDARILDCSMKANCYFDRAYFLDNDVFVISEFSKAANKGDDNSFCGVGDSCLYTIKVHVIDLKNNKRYVYESPSLDLVLSETIPNL